MIDPTTGQPFPGNIIPPDRLNSVSQKIQDKILPIAEFRRSEHASQPELPGTQVRPYDPSTYWTARIDHKFADKDLVFGRYTWSRLYNRPWEGNLPTIGLRWQQRDDRAATTSWTHTFRPTLLNEVRWGFGLNNNPINYDFSKGSTQHGLDLVNELGGGLAPTCPTSTAF